MNKFKLLFLLLISLSATAQTILPPGFPDRSPNLDVLPGFKTPPAGYGDVAFYWWIGDKKSRACKSIIAIPMPVAQVMALPSQVSQPCLASNGGNSSIGFLKKGKREKCLLV